MPLTLRPNRPGLAGVLAAALAVGALAGCNTTSPHTSAAQGGKPRMTANAAATPREEDRQWDRAGNTPINADTHFAAGQLAEAQGSTDRALDQYQRALRLNPRHANAHFRRGVIYTRQKNYDAALRSWNGYLKATGGSAGAYANLGFCHEVAGRGPQAETAYLAGIRADPRNAACRVNYGLWLARREKYNEAATQMRAVLSEAETHYNLASIYEQKGRREQAKVEYQKAVALDPLMREAQARLDEME